MALELKLVDGFKIRNSFDVDFSGEGSDVMYAYIPQGEMWLDEVLAGEKDFFVELHNFERQLLLSGVSYADARKKICETFVSKSNIKPNVMLGDYSQQPADQNCKVLIVDGELVRKFYDPKFIQGGHDLVYDYIPKNSIWMEKAFEKEYLFTLLHESHERALMCEGMKYYDAHDRALIVEKIERAKLTE